MPFWLGLAELILWEPGETVVILREKRLVPMADPAGGYRIISAVRGEEYKGRISYKTRLLKWTSDPILTSDGLSVHLSLGLWWRICDANLYVSKISSEYHVEEKHSASDDLSEAAEYWIKNLAGGTLREQVNKLPAEKLISPYVQAYIQVSEGKSIEPIPQFPELLEGARSILSGKAKEYGIEIERVEVQELRLPGMYQEKLEAVRVAFLEPHQAKAETDAKVIALRGLASVIGTERTGLIEILKHVDVSKAATAYAGIAPIATFLQPISGKLDEQVRGALKEDTKALPDGSEVHTNPTTNERK